MYSEIIRQLTKQLYPKGRAFKIPEFGILDILHKALAVSESQAYSDAIDILNRILPDNNNFTTEDAEDWERRLGLITNTSVSLADRKAAIIRKINHPGDIPARQNYRYVQAQLQLAGFDVYVHENPNGLTPAQAMVWLGVGQMGDYQLSDEQLGNVFTVNPDLFQAFQLGDYQMGSAQLNQYVFTEKVVNSLDSSIDAGFYVYPSYRSVFYIGGETFGTIADVDSDREKEFRQLILKLKPARTVAFLLINYN